MWLYELRRPDRSLVDERGGYRTEQEARSAGEQAKDMIEAFRFPHEKKLTVTTKRNRAIRAQRRADPY